MQAWFNSASDALNNAMSPVQPEEKEKVEGEEQEPEAPPEEVALKTGIVRSKMVCLTETFVVDEEILEGEQVSAVLFFFLFVF
jgi:hypothetical protein